MIRKILTYLCLFISILYVYRELLYIGLRKNKQGVFHKYNEIFLDQGPGYDALFMGSSRAEMHFNPRIFDSITHLNSYNIGISGATPKINFAVLKVFCANHQAPRFLVYDIDFYGLKFEADTLSGFPHYFPYLQNKLLRTELSKIDPRFNSFYYNPLHSLPYSQVRYISASLHGWLNVTGKYDSFCYKGFQTADPNGGFLDKTESPVSSFIHCQKRAYIDSIITFAKQHQIQLLLTSSPVFFGGKLQLLHKKQLMSQLQDIAVLNGLNYLDYSEPAFCYERRFFMDRHHLNESGARLFSGLFSEKFRNIYLKFPLSQGNR